MSVKAPESVSEAYDLVRRCAQEYMSSQVAVKRARGAMYAAAADLQEARRAAMDFLSELDVKEILEQAEKENRL